MKMGRGQLLARDRDESIAIRRPRKRDGVLTKNMDALQAAHPAIIAFRNNPIRAATEEPMNGVPSPKVAEMKLN